MFESASPASSAGRRVPEFYEFEPRSPRSCEYDANPDEDYTNA